MAEKVIETERQNIHAEHSDLTEADKKYAHASDAETAKYVGAPVEIDAATNKRLFWKINKRILAIMLVTYFCQSLDKGTLNFASIMDIQDDAHLEGQQVSEHAIEW